MEDGGVEDDAVVDDVDDDNVVLLEVLEVVEVGGIRNRGLSNPPWNCSS